MATGIASTTPLNETPYITLSEYKNAPTAIDFDNLVIGGNAAAQNAELTNMILRASSFMNEYLNQNLNASVQVETQRTRMTPQGYIALHPNNNPVLSLSNFQYGSNPNNLITLSDCSTAWFEDQQVIIPLAALSTTYTSQGSLALGGYGFPGAPIFCKYTYVAGYVNTTVVTAVAAATSFVVADGSGIQAGQVLRIWDGANSESVTVASTYTYGSTTVPLASALAYNHAAGMALGNMPTAIKQACILVTTAFIKARGDSSLTMALTTRASGASSGAELYGSDIAMAIQMLDLYRRIR